MDCCSTSLSSGKQVDGLLLVVHVWRHVILQVLVLFVTMLKLLSAAQKSIDALRKQAQNGNILFVCLLRSFVLRRFYLEILLETLSI